MKKINKKIPTIIGLFILVFGIAAGILLIQQQQIFHLGATATNQPKDVRITNISHDSFTISWTTDEKVAGSIYWGEETSSFDKTEADEITNLNYTHSVTVRGLTPSQTYYLKIGSEENQYDNNGTPWQVTTGPSLGVNADGATNTVSGTVLTSIGTPAANALVYVSIGGVSPLSTVASENGSWVISLANARTTDLTSYYQIKESQDLLEISVQAGADGIASAQIYPQAAKPVPPIILGQVHDFKALPVSKTDTVPSANLEAPAESTKSSRFAVDETAATPSAQNVTLESIKEGETVTSTKPEFFGEAPAGTKVTITVESDNPQGAVVSVPKNGDWSWSPPQGLSPGTHKVTLSWKNANGIMQTITKTFIVQAAEGPAFVSTPSATATARSSATPKVGSTPKTSSASGTPRATSTSAAIPVSGTLTPTILMAIMGMGLITFAISIGYLAFSKKEL